MMGGISAVVEVQVNHDGGSDTASATLTLEPAPSPDETWTLTGNGSSLSSVQWLEVDGGTSGLVPGETRTLVVEVQQSNWEEWTNNGTGETQAQNTTYEAAVNAPVTFYIQSGDGSLDSMSSVTATSDWQGRASATFTMGGSAAVVAVVAGDASTGELDGGSVEFTPGAPAEETWELTSSESSLSVSLAAEYDGTELAPGEERFLLATVTQTTWDVYTSNYGNTMDDNVNTTAAAQVPVYFTLEEGDGTVYDQGATGPDGVAATLFQMGTTASRVRADVLDDNGIPVSSATLDLTLFTEEWTHTSDEATLLVNLSTPDAVVDVAAGTVCTVTAEVRYHSWEIWTSSSGLVEKRNEGQSAAEGASLNWSVESGDGTLVDVNTSTDAEGRVTVTFMMGMQDSQLRADAWFGGIISSAATLDFTAPSTEPEWIWQSSESALDVYLTPLAGGDGVNAQVSLVIWDVYALSTDATLTTKVRNVDSAPAIGAQVEFGISNGSVGTSSAWTNANGDATTLYLTGEPADITAMVYFGGLDGSGSLAVEPNALTITTETLPDGFVGIDYAAPIVVAHGTAPYSFTLVSGSGDTGLPFGYDLQGSSIVGVGDSSSGSQQAGSYSFTVEVTDNSGQTAQKQLSLVLQPASEAPLAIATQSLPYAGTGLPYSTSVLVTGSQSTSGVDFSVDALPPGMTFDNTGLLSGSVPASGSYTFNVTAQEMGTGGEVRSASAALTLVAVSPEVTIVAGNEQVAWGGEAFEPLTVRLTVAGTPVPGAQITFDGATVITDASGLAEWNPGTAPATMGVFTIAANGGDTGATFVLGSAGPCPVRPDAPPISSEPQLGPPKIPDVVPLADAEAEVESRWLSINKGTVEASYTAGTATGFNNGNLSTVVEPGGPSPWSKTNNVWSASDGRTQQTSSPPAWPDGLDDVWVSGAATASISKSPDTDLGPVIGLVAGALDWLPSWARLIDFGGWYGKSKDNSEETKVQVRLKRVSGTAAISRTFIAVTEEDGVVTSVESIPPLVVAENAPQSEPYLLTVSTNKTGKLVKKRLLPVELRQPKLMPGRGIGDLMPVASVRFCRWRDSFLDANGVDTDGELNPNFIASDPDRCVVRIPDVLIDPASPYVGVRVTGIIGVSDQAEDDTGVMTLTKVGDFWETKPLIFVADCEDDLTYNGASGDGAENDAGQHEIGDDQTRLAGFGATIQVRFQPEGYDSPVTIDVATMMQPIKNVPVMLNVVTMNGQAATADQRQQMLDQFNVAKLIYRQVGYNLVLVQQGEDIVGEYPLPTNYQSLIVDEPIAGTSATFRVLDGRTKASTGKTVLEFFHDSSSGINSYQWYGFVDVDHMKTANSNSAGGVSSVDGNWAVIALKGTADKLSTAAHEQGHCLGLEHPGDNGFADDGQLLMSTKARNWDEMYTDQKRFHYTDPANLKSKY